MVGCENELCAQLQGNKNMPPDNGNVIMHITYIINSNFKLRCSKIQRILTIVWSMMNGEEHCQVVLFSTNETSDFCPTYSTLGSFFQKMSGLCQLACLTQYEGYKKHGNGRIMMERAKPRGSFPCQKQCSKGSINSGCQCPGAPGPVSIKLLPNEALPGSLYLSMPRLQSTAAKVVTVA